jgi:glyoxylase-like metal-dependent hydrolase (beta-lactamase superfamily II)
MAESSGIQPFTLEMNLPNGYSMQVHAALLWDEKELILVDTGLPGQLEVIREGLIKAGFSLERLTKIIITHQDTDHIGGLPELIAATGGRVEVLAHEKGVPYLTGEAPLVKSGKKAVPSKVDTALQDGDVLPAAGGIQAVYTPGHTPDHLCLYHIPSRTLISGDALVSHDGRLLPPAPQYTLDYSLALESVGKLAAMDIGTVITYHGGVCTEQIKKRLQDIAEGSPAQA